MRGALNVFGGFGMQPCSTPVLLKKPHVQGLMHNVVRRHMLWLVLLPSANLPF